jgi:hypothetical protein
VTLLGGKAIVSDARHAPRQDNTGIKIMLD